MQKSAKDILREKFSLQADKYYRVKLFDELGFKRQRCGSCGKFFWALIERKNCPDPPCETYGFIGNSPSDLKLDYIRTWRALENFFIKNGHTSVPTYPTVCRWFPGLYFTIASIVAFQRSVLGKPVFEFPSNPLIIPQVCLRFPDIENVGVTGRHYTSFIMIGQHSSYQPEEGKGYWKDNCIDLDWRLLTNVFRIPPEEITFVEDVWLGPSAFGYSLEYYVRGLELGNAVFTEFLGSPQNYSTMKPKVIDMGAGLERFTWILNGTDSSYDSTFGPVIQELKNKIHYDPEIFSRYSRLAGSLNLEDVDNVDNAKHTIAKQLSINYEKLREGVEQLEAAYAIADHAKTLLYAITDGQLPSNVGGGYNLRVILRRALSFIDEFKIDISLYEVCRAHAKYLKELNPRLVEGSKELKEILNVEEKRFFESRGRAINTIKSLLNKKVKLDESKMVELYESNGITPELIKEVSKKHNVEVSLPSKIYLRVTEKHVQEKEEEKRRIDIKNLPKTRLLFYEDQNLQEFDAKVLKIINISKGESYLQTSDIQQKSEYSDGNKYVILDQTAFYGRSGGQEPDHGEINGFRVYDVEKIGDVIVHAVENPNLIEGQIIHGKIDWTRRQQLMIHHTATHILNGAAREILGNHIWQNSAFKDVDYARLDITHYEIPEDKILNKIEERANQIIIDAIKTKKYFINRPNAEEKFGFSIYQGGAAPQEKLRIMEIPGFDVEACGGTHVDRTSEVQKILITNVEKIQDGVIRINFVSGPAAQRWLEEQRNRIKEIADILGCRNDQIIAKAKMLLNNWKISRKRLENKRKNFAAELSEELESKFENNVLITEIPNAGIKDLQEISLRLSRYDRIIILFGINDEVSIFASAGKETGIHIGKIISSVCKKLGGKGGGKDKLAQGIGKYKDKLKETIKELKKELIK